MTSVLKPRFIAAQANVAQARAALIDTAREIQQRLQPKTLAREAWESAKIKGADIAEDAVDAVKRRPVATGGVIAAVAVLLARSPIKDGVGRLFAAMTSHNKAEAPPQPVRAKQVARKPVLKRKAATPRPKRKTETK